ncbi:hypothetical protein C0J52_16228 [Blattella germanica]|nr:hypothetical protein C0J52_16228 [Blattella germanica]
MKPLLLQPSCWNENKQVRENKPFIVVVVVVVADRTILVDETGCERLIFREARLLLNAASTARGRGSEEFQLLGKDVLPVSLLPVTSMLQYQLHQTTNVKVHLLNLQRLDLKPLPTRAGFTNSSFNLIFNCDLTTILLFFLNILQIKMQRHHLSSDQVEMVVRLQQRGERQVDIADLIGTSQSVISRVLSRFRDTGLVTRRPGSGSYHMTAPRQDRHIIIQARRTPFATARHNKTFRTPLASWFQIKQLGIDSGKKRQLDNHLPHPTTIRELTDILPIAFNEISQDQIDNRIRSMSERRKTDIGERLVGYRNESKMFPKRTRDKLCLGLDKRVTEHWKPLDNASYNFYLTVRGIEEKQTDVKGENEQQVYRCLGTHGISKLGIRNIVHASEYIIQQFSGMSFESSQAELENSVRNHSFMMWKDRVAGCPSVLAFCRSKYFLHIGVKLTFTSAASAISLEVGYMELSEGVQFVSDVNSIKTLEKVQFSVFCKLKCKSTRKMSCKRKLTSEDIERELAQDTDSECDSEIGEFLGPDEEEDEGGEVAPPPGSEPGTSELEGNIEGEAGPSGSRSPTWGSRISNLSPLKFTGNQRGFVFMWQQRQIAIVHNQTSNSN